MKIEFDIQERPKDMGIKGESSTDIYNLKEVQALLKEDKLLDSLYKRYMREDNGMLESLEEILQDISFEISDEFNKNKQNANFFIFNFKIYNLLYY